jgi:hypothetical protein
MSHYQKKVTAKVAYGYAMVRLISHCSAEERRGSADRATARLLRERLSAQGHVSRDNTDHEVVGRVDQLYADVLEFDRYAIRTSRPWSRCLAYVLE